MIAVDWLYDNANQFFDWIVADAVTLATIVYAALTFLLLRQTILLRQTETEPEVAIYLAQSKRSSQLMEMIIHNTGRGAAHEVHISDLTPSSESMAIPNFKPLYPRYIRYIPPGQEINSLFGVGFLLVQDERFAIPSIRVSYKGTTKRIIEREYWLDPKVFVGQLTPSDPATKMAQSLQRIAQSLTTIGHVGPFDTVPKIRVEIVKPYRDSNKWKSRARALVKRVTARTSE